MKTYIKSQQDTVQIVSIESALHRMYLAKELIREGHTKYGAHLLGTARVELMSTREKIRSKYGSKTETKI